MHVLRRQSLTLLFFILAALGMPLLAQRELNRADHDDWPYYFGMTLAYNQSYLHSNKDLRFLQDDSIQRVEPGANGGIALGLMGTLKVTRRLEARFNPQLIIGSSRTFTYTLNNPAPGEAKTVVQQLPSTLVSFPIQTKFTSDRIGNFRVYMLGGFRADIDLASNSSARNAENIIKLKRSDYGVEAGIGFNFYLPFVTVSPEIKFFHGLADIHARDPNLKYSSVIDKLQTRMIQFSLHLED